VRPSILVWESHVDALFGCGEYATAVQAGAAKG
jgi:hypothetical protein